MINKYNETYQIHNTIKTQSNTRKCKLLIINSNCFFLPASRNNHRHSLWKHCVQLCNPNPSPLLWELNLCEWLPCKNMEFKEQILKKMFITNDQKCLYLSHIWKDGFNKIHEQYSKSEQQNREQWNYHIYRYISLLFFYCTCTFVTNWDVTYW